MGLEYVDIFYYYWFDLQMLLMEMMCVFDYLVYQGKVLYVGIFNYFLVQVWEVVKIFNDFGIFCIIYQFCYLMFECGVEEGLLDFLQMEGIGSIVFLLLVGG